ncbi:hypothetical protein SRABI76_03443 [Microbacterium oxydans]|uniref:FAR-17a/AIG1-like protein n=1 Tax=Microbacterium oxydans TaxID=82380 RepID=A0A0F0LLW7_9MICO|nr:Pr6Pr family membrane protein [Microbacterium oxydans]KJL34197.1 hypothetical protein RS83_00028 [Microbacterium oxydans]CAH0259214.1 hypothetical protein SRABI76_03443 [Microbacterium oxydans]
MTAETDFARRVAAWGLCRTVAGVFVVAVLCFGYGLRIAVGDANPFDYFGYFTNQTSLLAAGILIATGSLMIVGRRVPPVLTLARGIVTAYLLVVALIYNLLVPGTGSAPPWMSFVLHVVFPLLVALDWVFIGDRPRLAWRRMWMLLPYPIAWLVVVLVRGVTDGWVPYGFLLPERGLASLLLHIVGLLATVIAAGALVWAASRSRGALLADGPKKPRPGRASPLR